MTARVDGKVEQVRFLLPALPSAESRLRCNALCVHVLPSNTLHDGGTASSCASRAAAALRLARGSAILLAQRVRACLRCLAGFERLCNPRAFCPLGSMCGAGGQLQGGAAGTLSRGAMEAPCTLNLKLHARDAGGQLQGGAAGAVPRPRRAPQNGQNQAAHLPQGRDHQHRQGRPHPGAPLRGPGLAGGAPPLTLVMIQGSNLVAGALSLPSVGTGYQLDPTSDRQSLAWAIKRRTLTCGLLSRHELPLSCLSFNLRCYSARGTGDSAQPTVQPRHRDCDCLHRCGTTTR